MSRWGQDVKIEEVPEYLKNSYRFQGWLGAFLRYYIAEDKAREIAWTWYKAEHEGKVWDDSGEHAVSSLEMAEIVKAYGAALAEKSAAIYSLRMLTGL